MLAEGDAAVETLAKGISFYAGISACDKRAQWEVALSLLRCWICCLNFSAKLATPIVREEIYQEREPQCTVFCQTNVCISQLVRAMRVTQGDCSIQDFLCQHHSCELVESKLGCERVDLLTLHGCRTDHCYSTYVSGMFFHIIFLEHHSLGWLTGALEIDTSRAAFAFAVGSPFVQGVGPTVTGRAADRPA